MNLLLFIGALTPYTFPVQTLQLKSEQAHFIEFCLRNIEPNEVPTSIKIAQAILESGWGKSELSKSLNLHGVKCFTNCDDFVLLYDDKPKEKFRVFKSYKESFEYNNRLLSKRKVSGDYKVWAKSLRWYATNPRYPEKLIYIIEKYELFKFDGNARNNKKT